MKHWTLPFLKKINHIKGAFANLPKLIQLAEIKSKIEKKQLYLSF